MSASTHDRTGLILSVAGDVSTWLWLSDGPSATFAPGEAGQRTSTTQARSSNTCYPGQTAPQWSGKTISTLVDEGETPGHVGVHAGVPSKHVLYRVSSRVTRLSLCKIFMDGWWGMMYSLQKKCEMCEGEKIARERKMLTVIKHHRVGLEMMAAQRS